MLNWNDYPNFKRDEFDSSDEPSSGDNMKHEFMQRLQCARDIAGVSFKINSGYRTKSHNEKVGGKLNSSHLYGCAADIHCADDITRWKILSALMDAGFNRIGISKTFIHVDSDETKNADRIWMY